MNTLKDFHQVAYKPISVGNGIWIPSDTICYSSKQTLLQKHNENGLLYYEIKDGLEEKTTFIDLFPTAKYVQNVNSSLVNKFTYHYELGGILKKITFISYHDKFEIEHIDKEFFYENDSVICLHYSFDKPSFYEKTTLLKNKKIVENWKHDKTPYQKYEYHYDEDKLITLIQIHLPSNTIEQYWEHKYDERGNCILVQLINPRRATQYNRLFEFDKYNNCIREQLICKPTNRLMEDFTNFYEYNELGNWIRKVIYVKNEIQWFVDNKSIMI